MNEIDKTNLIDQTKFRLNEISKTENYFNQEINQRKLCSNKLSEYATAFDYKNKILVVLSATSGGVCIISSVSWNSSSTFYFNFFSNNRNNEKIAKHNKKQKEKAR